MKPPGIRVKGMGQPITRFPGHGKGGPMPEFTTTSQSLWVNSKPLKKAQLKGKVLLLEVWTSI